MSERQQARSVHFIKRLAYWNGIKGETREAQMRAARNADEAVYPLGIEEAANKS